MVRLYFHCFFNGFGNRVFAIVCFFNVGFSILDLQSSFFRLWQNVRLLPHLHLPLQSGCDSILRRMGRRTTCASFRALLRSARSAIPDLAVSTDVMVGFPGESDAEFEQSFEFVESMAFAHMHIFRYSRRIGTSAADMPAHVPEGVAKHRSSRLHELDRCMQARFRQRFVGRKLNVLWERARAHEDGLCWSGLTPNYLRVVTHTSQQVDLHNAVTETSLLAVVDDGLLGEVVAPLDFVSQRMPVELALGVNAVKYPPNVPQVQRATIPQPQQL